MVVYLVTLVKSQEAGGLLINIYHTVVCSNIKQSPITSHMCLWTFKQRKKSDAQCLVGNFNMNDPEMHET